MNIFNNSEVNMCIGGLSISDKPVDVLEAWRKLNGQYPNLSSVIQLDNYDRNVLPQCVQKHTKRPDNYLIPYFKSDNLYFIDDEMIKSIFIKGTNVFPIDHSVMMDSNICSYIDSLVRGKPLGTVGPKLLPIIDDLLRDGLNFDFLFYMIENIKHVLPSANFSAKSKLEFWKSLNINFRKNLVSLHYFSSIDSKEYSRTLRPSFLLSYRQSARRAIDATFGLYMSSEGKNYLSQFADFQRVALLSLIGMLRINLSSNKSGRNKMLEFFDFMHSEVGIYMEREAILAHEYFCDSKSLPILKKIQKGGNKKKLLKKLDNIAWNMITPRLMERLMSSGLGAKTDYFIPIFMTFDEDLKHMLESFQVKLVIYDKDSGDSLSIPECNSSDYFENAGLKSCTDYFFSEVKKKERQSRRVHTRESILPVLFSEYRKLRQAI
ncbi:hypothetical protein NB557_04570 [Vibrio alginolyticus]|uniref:hypothetical protein n=1 Tax=Vibrio antiquarius (strain Ex25) TaxID=150340 RepID=UPI00265848CB|nr:hypothetical protein [Vibrio antiquarius]MCE9846269.1 hypothetical protein [Vibrio antiquarius]MCR9672533.1 hypothetical protein [Vibrio alginolyticus]